MNDRISFTADYCQKAVNNMLYQVEIPMERGIQAFSPALVGGYVFDGVYMNQAAAGDSNWAFAAKPGLLIDPFR
ncbi:hypothetical protein GCM10027347_01320 [Larkinella harenae]